MLTAARFLVWAGAICAAGLATFSFLAPWLPVADAVGHFRHMLVVAMIGAACLFALWRRRVAVMVAALALAIIAATPEWRPPGRDDSMAPDLTVMQHNLLFNNRSVDQIAAQILTAAPDVVMLQEVSTRNHRILDRLAARYPARIVCRFNSVMSVAILSSRPFEARPDCETGRGMVSARIAVHGVAVSLVSVHLHWPWPYGQTAHVSRLLDDLAALPQPVIVAGDFNAAASSHTVRRIARATGTRVIAGLRQTIHISRYRLPLPIDHILLPEGAVLSEVAVGGKAGSDHNAVIARFALPR